MYCTAWSYVAMHVCMCVDVHTLYIQASVDVSICMYRYKCPNECEDQRSTLNVFPITLYIIIVIILRQVSHWKQAHQFS